MSSWKLQKYVLSTSAFDVSIENILAGSTVLDSSFKLRFLYFTKDRNCFIGRTKSYPAWKNVLEALQKMNNLTIHVCSWDNGLFGVWRLTNNIYEWHNLRFNVVFSWNSCNTSWKYETWTVSKGSLPIRISNPFILFPFSGKIESMF